MAKIFWSPVQVVSSDLNRSGFSLKRPHGFGIDNDMGILLGEEASTKWNVDNLSKKSPAITT